MVPPVVPPVPGQSPVSNKTALQEKEMAQDPRSCLSFINTSKESWPTRQITTTPEKDRGPDDGHATRSLDEGYFMIARQVSCRYKAEATEGRELDANTTKLLVRPHSDLREYALNFDREVNVRYTQDRYRHFEQ